MNDILKIALGVVGGLFLKEGVDRGIEYAGRKWNERQAEAPAKAKAKAKKAKKAKAKAKKAAKKRSR